MEYNWKKELQAPELTNDFKWRFAVDNLKPKMEIEGPSVGSLLYAMNPKTSELGLKQMDSELNQQLAANSNFDKRGDAAMRFMEQRVAEDIAAKQFADKMDMERIKAQNVDAGHVNSLLANYTDALSKGLHSAEIIEDQIRKTLPNADAIIAQGKAIAAKNQAQKDLYGEFIRKIPTGSMWNTENDRDSFITDVLNSNMTEQQKTDAITKARSVNDKENYRSNQNTTAVINAGAQHNANKTTELLNKADALKTANTYIGKKMNILEFNQLDKEVRDLLTRDGHGNVKLKQGV